MMYHWRNPVKFRSHVPKKRCKMRGSRIYIQDIPLKSPASPTRKQGAESGRSRFLSRFAPRSEEHTSELQSLMRISYAVFCLKKNKKQTQSHTTNTHLHTHHTHKHEHWIYNHSNHSTTRKIITDSTLKKTH